MPTILLLSGPNLNLFGDRQPEIYGTATLAEIESRCRDEAGDLAVDFRQSNSEAALIDMIHEATDSAAGIIINPAAFSFTSMAIMDALKMFPGPIIEVHITNIHRREEMYHQSYVSKVATAVIAGLGAESYLAAVRAIRVMLARAGGAAS